jgi:hypothetical protein
MKGKKKKERTHMDERSGCKFTAVKMTTSYNMAAARSVSQRGTERTDASPIYFYPLFCMSV